MGTRMARVRGASPPVSARQVMTRHETRPITSRSGGPHTDSPLGGQFRSGLARSCRLFSKRRLTSVSVSATQAAPLVWRRHSLSSDGRRPCGRDRTRRWRPQQGRKPSPSRLAITQRLLTAPRWSARLQCAAATSHAPWRSAAGEVDETNDEEESLDPEQARRTDHHRLSPHHVFDAVTTS